MTEVEFGCGDCREATPAFTQEEVERVVVSFDALEDDWESQEYTIALLKDGRYGFVDSSSDSSGHGCRCHTYTAVAADLESAFLLIPESDRELARAKAT